MINAKHSSSVSEEIRSLSNGGVHLSLDALGSHETCVNSIQCLRKRGKHVQVGLMAGTENAPNIPMARVIADELEILGSHGMQAHRYDALFAMIEQGKLQPERLVGQQVSLERAAKMLTEMNQFKSLGITVIDQF